MAVTTCIWKAVPKPNDGHMKFEDHSESQLLHRESLNTSKFSSPLLSGVKYCHPIDEMNITFYSDPIIHPRQMAGCKSHMFHLDEQVST